MGDFIQPADFFTHLFGFRESLDAVSANLEVLENVHGVTLRSRANNKSYMVGQFATRTLDSFRLPECGARGTFSIVVGSGVETRDFHKVDVAALQAAPENRGATFQVASNFNCLEFINSKQTAKKGVSCYCFDHTQGPAASISAAPATVYRNYHVRHGPPSAPPATGQLDTELNLLDLLPAIPVVHGYVRLTEADCVRLAASDFNPLNICNVKVGVQRQTQVTFGIRQDMMEVCPDEAQRVHQVFTAAVNMGDIHTKHSMVATLARMLLRAAYRGTILAAAENARLFGGQAGSNKLFLTLIGGGVFGNASEWIVEAILECRPLIEQSGLDVTLVVFINNLEPPQFERLVQLCVATGGHITHCPALARKK